MPSPSFFFFVGENTFQLSHDVQRWVAMFKEKHGPENLVELEGRKCVPSELIDAVATMPFIAEKRLVLLRGVPSIEREELQAVLDNMHPQTILLIVDPKPDKRLGITKDIEKAAEVKSYSLLSRGELCAWMKQTARACGSVLSDASCDALLSIVGDDQWILESEIQKLCLFCGETEISREAIDTLCVPSGSQVVWRLTDLVASGKPLEAISFLRHRLDRGEDAYGLWSILLSMIKNIALVYAAASDGERSEKTIAAATGMNFFSVRSLLPLVRGMRKDQLKTLIDWAAGMDIALKTGGFHATAEHTTEVAALTERAILLCAAHR